MPVASPGGPAAPAAPAAPTARAPAAARTAAPVTEPLPATAPECPVGAPPEGQERDRDPWGYAWQPEEPPPATARWVAGVGYVEPADKAEPVGEAGSGSEGVPQTPTPGA